MIGELIMKEIFGTAAPVEEARAVAKANTRAGRKPGLNLFILLLITTVLFEVIHKAPNFVKFIVPVIGKIFTDDTEPIQEFLKNNSLYLYLYLTVLPIIAFILYARIFEKRKITSLGFVRKKMPLFYIIGVGIALLLIGVVVGICVITGALSIGMNGMSAGSLILYICGWMVQGLSEEVLCRGFLLTSVARRYSVTLSVLVNSLFFSLVHILNPGYTVLAFINITLFGIFLSLLFIKTENIWACAGFHAVWNLMQGNILGIAVSGMAIPTVFASTFNEKLTFLNGGDFGLEGGLGVTITLLVACLIMYFLIRKSNRKA